MLCGLAVAVLLAACVPAHPVRPYPDHIRAGIEPGDRVEIVTHDGQEHAFIVERVTATGLAGDGRDVAYGEIAEIRRRSWQEPAPLCGDSLPLGCSVPKAVIVTSDFHEEYARRFRRACVQHDFCYRHGHLTYGTSREDCDRRFQADMQAECQPDISMTGVLKIESVTDCRLAADQMYLAVRQFGEQHFRTATSTYCEYDGPPPPSPGASPRTPASRTAQ